MKTTSEAIRDLRDAFAALWWEIVYASRLDRFVGWLNRRLRPDTESEHE